MSHKLSHLHNQDNQVCISHMSFLLYSNNNRLCNRYKNFDFQCMKNIPQRKIGTFHHHLNNIQLNIVGNHLHWCMKNNSLDIQCIGIHQNSSPLKKFLQHKKCRQLMTNNNLVCMFYNVYIHNRLRKLHSNS